MGYHHNHHDHHQGIEGKKLLFTVVLNFGITIAEFVGGIFSNSLALISDAVHNLSDAVALLITYLTFKISKKAADPKHTFGYKRIQILAALFNSVTLIVICVFLLYEAYDRFMNPEPIESVIMLVVALIGLIANLLSVLLLKDHSKDNLNIKAAYLHLVGDTLSSVAVIIGGILIYFYEVYWIDPLITVLISLYIIKETYSVLYETYKILMQQTPSDISIEEVVGELKQIKGIRGVHHIHVWNLTDSEVHFEGHVDLEKDIKVSESETILEKVKKILKEKFEVQHITLQLEYNSCNDKGVIHNENYKL